MLMWLTNFKIAIVEKDSPKIKKLLSTMPQFEKRDEVEQAMYLLKEASKLMHKLKDETSITMKKMQKHRDFLNSTQAPQINKFDIKL